MLVSVRTFILVGVPLVTIIGIYILNRRKKMGRPPENPPKETVNRTKASEKSKNGFIRYDQESLSPYDTNHSSAPLLETTLLLHKNYCESLFLDIENKSNGTLFSSALPMEPQSEIKTFQKDIDYSNLENSNVSPISYVNLENSASKTLQLDVSSKPLHEDSQCLEENCVLKPSKNQYLQTQSMEALIENNVNIETLSPSPIFSPSSNYMNCESDSKAIQLSVDNDLFKSSSPQMDHNLDLIVRDLNTNCISNIDSIIFNESSNQISNISDWNITINTDDVTQDSLVSDHVELKVHTSHDLEEEECSKNEQISPDSGIFLTESCQELDNIDEIESSLEDTNNLDFIELDNINSSETLQYVKIDVHSPSVLSTFDANDSLHKNMCSQKSDDKNTNISLKPNTSDCGKELELKDTSIDDSQKVESSNSNNFAKKDFIFSENLSQPKDKVEDTSVLQSSLNSIGDEPSETSILKKKSDQKDYSISKKLDHSENHLSNSHEKYTGARRKQKDSNVSNELSSIPELPIAVASGSSVPFHNLDVDSTSDKRQNCNVAARRKHKFALCPVHELGEIKESSCQNNGWLVDDDFEYNSSQFQNLQPHKGALTSSSSIPYSSQDSLELDEVWEIRFYLAPDLSGRLIGRGGRRIKRLRENTSTNIYVNTIDDAVDEIQVCVIRGHKENAKQALAEIEMLFPGIEIRSTYHVFLQNTTILFPENTFEAKISCIQDMNCIFIQQPHHPCFHNLSILENDLQTHCSIVAPPPRPVAVGCVYGARMQSKWCRVSVVSYNSEADEVDVFYVDYGGYIHLSVANLRPLQLKHAELPNLASECRLANLIPSNGEFWQENDAPFLTSLTTDSQQFLRCKVQYYDEYGLPYVLLFRYDSEKKTYVCVNRELEREGIAVWM